MTDIILGVLHMCIFPGGLCFFGPLQTQEQIFFRGGNKQIVMGQQKHPFGVAAICSLKA